MLTKIRLLKRNIKFWIQKRTRGWSDDETWNLDYEFIKWINSRFKKFLEKADKIVNLEYWKFKYKRKEYTQKELIEKVIQLSDQYLDEKWLSENKYKIAEEILDLWKLLYWHMWW